eukprot:TRINITY_DN21619_c0_g2_i3.p1 TRINITY_DN21619_c0_g2~~TRINITY_DN21619_c0_g2_i3.p1  ORF type:complete len:318 (-),score=48.67 TRINITY_DN21619_c0_g2_i3:103-1056(-)
MPRGGDTRQAAPAAKAQYGYGKDIEGSQNALRSASASFGRISVPLPWTGKPTALVISPAPKALLRTGEFSFRPTLTPVREKKDKWAGKSIKERTVLKSGLHDTLKVDCLERLKRIEASGANKSISAMEQDVVPEEAREKEVVLCEGFRVGDEIVARKDLYVTMEVMAKFLDRGIIVGPSTIGDDERVLVKWEARRDGTDAAANVLGTEILRGDIGRLMQLQSDEVARKKRRPPQTRPCENYDSLLDDRLFFADLRKDDPPEVSLPMARSWTCSQGLKSLPPLEETLGNTTQFPQVVPRKVHAGKGLKGSMSLGYLLQ